MHIQFGRKILKIKEIEDQTSRIIISENIKMDYLILIITIILVDIVKDLPQIRYSSAGFY